MEGHEIIVSGCSPASVDLGAQFLRIIILVHTGILMSSQFSAILALDLPSPSVENSGVGVLDVSYKDVVANSRDLLPPATSQHGVDISSHHNQERHRGRDHVSSYVKAAQERHRFGARQRRRMHGPSAQVHLRKLADEFGCLADPTICTGIPGWTAASSASTCCPSGFCTDIQFDALNCGACGNACTFGFFCCSATCVALGSDPNNCGACGTVCLGGNCIYGFCNY